MNQETQTFVSVVVAGLLGTAFLMIMLLTSCTTEVILSHTEGQTTDLIDSTQKVDGKADVSL